MKIAFFGSSLLSAYWNGAATYWRGVTGGLAALGHEVWFFEPDAFDRQQHRDLDAAPWATVKVYPAGAASDVLAAVRAARVSKFFSDAAAQLPGRAFVLGGSGWGDHPRVAELSNVNYVGHVYTRDHNASNCSAEKVLNVNRDSMARLGFSPATRVFEAAGAGACLITDRWPGIEAFLTPGEEVLVADDGDDVARLVREVSSARAREIGDAARRRVLREHTYEQRAAQLQDVLGEVLDERRAATEAV